MKKESWHEFFLCQDNASWVRSKHHRSPCIGACQGGHIEPQLVTALVEVKLDIPLGNDARDPGLFLVCFTIAAALPAACLQGLHPGVPFQFPTAAADRRSKERGKSVDRV